jgi:hypothetical protein
VPTSLRSPIAAVLVVVWLAGCGGSDDEGKPARKATKEPVAETTFKARDVGFTFSYPRGFEQVDEPNDGKVLASVTPTPNDPNNGVKVRLTSERELPFASYAAQLRSQFEDQLATKISQRQEKRRELDVGVLEWRKATTQTNLGEEETVRLHSTSYFFTGAGKTWQVECLSSEEHRADIEKACRQALGSIEFSS